ncbi:hypothetical protein RP20_CCG026194 [Aedes albopictus]|nr:hypothetical protein RP20_CCG026194 [Aedes albopictus]
MMSSRMCHGPPRTPQGPACQMRYVYRLCRRRRASKKILSKVCDPEDWVFLEKGFQSGRGAVPFRITTQRDAAGLET